MPCATGRLPDTPVFVDGMVRDVCDVYRSHESFVSRSLLHEIRRAPHAFYTDSIQPVLRREDRRRVLDTSPCIIVASSGMLAGGPSQGYCQELVKNANDAILLTGYQDEESPGRALLDLARIRRPQGTAVGSDDRAGGQFVRHVRAVGACRPHADGLVDRSHLAADRRAGAR